MALVQRLEGGDYHSHHHHFGGASSHSHAEDHQSQCRSATAHSESTVLLPHDAPGARTYGSAHSAGFSEAAMTTTTTDSGAHMQEADDDKEPSSPSEPYFSGHHRFEPSSSHSLHNSRSRRTPSVWTLHDAIVHGGPRRREYDRRAELPCRPSFDPELRSGWHGREASDRQHCCEFATRFKFAMF